MVKNRGVRILVHEDFFYNWFEPKRKSFELKLGVPISQVKFTQIMAKKFRLPKQKPMNFKRSFLW